VVVCPSSNAIQASQLAHRLRAYIETLQVVEGKLSELRITVSIGVAECMPNFKEADQIVKHADMALYRAKNQGRNCVVVCDESLFQKKENL
jgi:diguanylate cyclase (GGDEF)-like protein